MAVQISAMELAILIRASSEGFGAFKQAEGGVRGIVAAMGAMRSELAALGAARAFAFIGTKIGEASTQLNSFSREMALIAAVSRDVIVTASVTSQLATDIRAFAKATIFTAEETAVAFRFLTQAGLATDDAMLALGPTLGIAAIGMLDMGRAADIVTDIMTGLRLPTDDLEQFTRVTDVLTLTFQSTTTDIEQLGGAFKFVGAIGKELGEEMETLAAAIGLISATGLKGRQAGTGLRKILLSLGSSTTAGSKAFRTLGIELFDLEGNFVGLTETVRLLNAANLNTEDRLSSLKDIVGTEALTAFVALLSQEEEFIALQAELQNAAGTTASSVKEMESSFFFFQKQIESIKADIMLEFGIQLESIFRELSGVIKDNEDGIRAFVTIIGQLAVVIGDFLLPPLTFMIKSFFDFAAFLLEHEVAVKRLSAVFVGLGVAVGSIGFLLMASQLAVLVSGIGVATIATRAWNVVLAITRGLLTLIAAHPAFFILGAAAGIATFVGLKKAGSFQAGTGPEGVRQSGLFFLHKGERVIPSGQNGNGTALANREPSQQNTFNIEMNVQEFDMDEVMFNIERTRMRAGI